MYSGRQPASTALIATFSATTTVFRPAISPRTSSRRNPAPASISATDFAVGGTTGSPSVQPRSKYASIRLAGSGSDMAAMIPPRSADGVDDLLGLALGRRLPGARVIHPQRALDFDHVLGPRERRRRGLSQRALAADRPEEVLEPGGRHQPEH